MHHAGHDALVADDDQIVAELLGITLGKYGFQVSTAVDAASAIAAASEREHLRAAICDLELGRDNGVDVLNAIHERHPACVGVIISGHLESVIAAAIGDSLWIRYLQKPFKSSELIELIDAEIADRLAR